MVAARRLLDPDLARLPDELEEAVLAACNAWDAGDPDRAGHLLSCADRAGALARLRLRA